MSWYGRSLFGGGSRTSGGVASVANAKELSKASYASESNQVSRPVMIDAEGRKMPVIVCTSNQSEQSYLVETIEPIRTPLVSEYTHGSPPKADLVKNYGNGYSPPTKAEPVKDYVRDDDNQRRHSSPARDRPREVEVFLNKVQTEASQPNRVGSLGASPWGQTPVSNEQTRYVGNSGYSYDKNGLVTEPTMRRPSRSAWAPATPRNDTKLDTPTSDIATAMENLKEGARGLSVTNVPPQSRYNIPLSTGPKRDTYSDTIDSSVRRYGNLNISSRPRTTGDTYDSREAAKRYGGASIA
ncbi:hypothetical protein I3843_07G009100 [Carya illinoinensis]|nr:hypothetical protein I3843_07G009100 [Carya illinoinensis]